MKTACPVFIDRYVAKAHQTFSLEEAYITSALWLHGQGRDGSLWLNNDGWRLNAPLIRRFFFDDGVEVVLTTSPQGIEGRCGNQTHSAHSLPHAAMTLQGDEIQVQLGEISHRFKLDKGRGENLAGKHVSTSISQASLPSHSGAFHLTSPMPGRVTSVLVALNEAVETNQPLLILEAMKMEHTICAPHAGVVDYLPFVSGDVVEGGVELIRLK